MGYGNGIGGSKKLGMKPSIRAKKYEGRFSSFYTGADTSRGAATLNRELGTVSFRKGSPFVKFLGRNGRSASFRLDELVGTPSVTKGVLQLRTK